MGNMSYCRFQNTVSDLDDCYEAMGEGTDELSPEEKNARRELIRMCSDIHADFGHEVQ